jgi:hypothetical protein
MGRGRSLSRGAAWVVAGLLAVGPASDAVAGLVGGPLHQPPLTVTGSVSGLVPGQAGTLRLVVANPGTADSVVERLDVRVTAVEGTCPASALRAQPWTGRVVVPAGRSVTRDVTVAVAEGCGEARWRLAYTAT